MTYNRRDQMTTITPAGGSAASMSYYEAGQKYLTSDGAASLLYSAQGVMQRTISGTTTNFVREPDGTPITQRVGSTRHHYIQDPIGSTLALIDSSGTVATRYSYEPYGKATSTSTTNTRWRFANGYLSSAAGDSLIQFGERYYDPKTARWTQQDPLSQLSDLRQANRYSYAGGAPVNVADHSGLGFSFSEILASGIKVAAAAGACLVSVAGPQAAISGRIVCQVGGQLAGYSIYQDYKD